MLPTNIVVIGAGSASFGLNTIAALLKSDRLRGSQIALVDRNAERVELMGRLAARLNRSWNANMVIMYQNVACKNMATLQGILDEQARERNIHMIWVEHDLMDPRTVSRRTMRDKVSNYMRTVMNAEPVDESLVDFEDDATW